MKKVFLLFGLAAFSSASAQQKDVFDIQKHLDKMVKDKKNPGAVARPSEKNTYLINHGFFTYGSNLSPILPNGNKVYLLDPGNMPCVVPDMKQFTTMPNVSNPNTYFESLAFRNDIPETMPNAVKPYRIIASK
jgi:hypothetical protein